MVDWVADGESGANVRAKLNTISNHGGAFEGLKFISEGPSVAWDGAPVEYFDVALPAGYSRFVFYFTDFASNTSDNNGMGYVFSADGGVTWLCDAVHGDTYSQGNPIGYATALKAAPYGVTTELILSPGDSVVIPGTYAFWGPNWGTVPNLATNPNISADGLNPAAFVTPVLQRMNKIRFMPLGNYDNPPTSGRTFVHGNWTLFGY